MIVRPLPGEDRAAERVTKFEPAWTIVARTQSVEAQQYLLIAQPDHARLSGELAALFRASFLPEIDEEIAKAIAAHDNGWTRFPFERELRGDPPHTATGRPQHFLQIPVEESLAAWAGSIESAGEISKLAAYMVSAHFSRIGRMRIASEIDTPEDLRHLESFVRAQEQWQAEHEAEIRVSKQQGCQYVDLLQFCDLLSLYLCCGSTHPARFPQQFAGIQISVQYRDGVFHTSPSLFGDTPQRFYLPARLYPGEAVTRIGFDVK